MRSVVGRLVLTLLVVLAACSDKGPRPEAFVLTCVDARALDPALRQSLEADALARVDELLRGEIDALYRASHPVLRQESLELDGWTERLAERTSRSARASTDLRLLSWTGKGKRGTALCGAVEDTDSYLRFSGDLPEGTRLAMVEIELPASDLSRRAVLEFWEHEGAWKLARLDVTPSAHGPLRARDFAALAASDAAAGDDLAQAIHLGAASALSQLGPRWKSGLLFRIESASKGLPTDVAAPRLAVEGGGATITGVRLHLFEDALSPVAIVAASAPLDEAERRAQARAALRTLRTAHPRFLEGFSVLLVEDLTAGGGSTDPTLPQHVMLAVDES